MRFFIKIISILLFISCSTDKSNRCTVHSSNIDISYELFTHLLSDQHHHYLFGAVEENQMDFRTSEITIVQSAVGDEKSWKPFSKNIPGKCQAISQTQKYIYVISINQYQELRDPKFSNHKLYRISKADKSITELYEFNQPNSFVRDVYFDSDERGYIFFRPSGKPLDYQFLKTNKSGKEWEVIELNRPVDVTHSNDEKLYFLSYKNNLKNNWIYKIDKKSDRLDSLQFDLNITDFSVGENEEFWLLGQEEGKTVLQHYKNGLTTVVHNFTDDADVFPKRLYKYNELMVVVASQIDENMLGGFGGTKTFMFVSNDNGLTWDNDRLDGALYLDPISFYKNEKLTAYVGDGKILTCKFQ